MAEDEEKRGDVYEHSHASVERESSSIHSREGDSDDESVIVAPGSDEKSRPPAETEDHLEGEPGESGGQAEDEPSAAAARSQSRASSTRSRALSIVPRNKRRGLFGRFAILPEVDRPYDYSNRMKWTITLIIALSAAGAPMGAGIFLPALHPMAAELHASPTTVNLTVALYMLSMAIFPLWWSFFSEILGRRTIYLTSFALFVVFSVLSAVSTNVAMLIVMRMLGGGASASVQAVGAGTIADIWEPRERGRAMGYFYLGPLTGPLFAPIIGGALSQRWGWQSTMWFLAIFGGLVLCMLFFCLPETLPRRKPATAPPPAATPDDDGMPTAASGSRPAPLSRMSTRQSVQQHTKKTALFLRRAFLDPLGVLAYLRFPPIAITVSFASITFGALFVLNIAVQSTFSSPPYAFPELVVGLLYLPSSLGYFVASALGGRWIDQIMAREARRAGRYDAAGRLVFLPEDRMRENAWIAGALYPAALLWFGWTADRGVLWVAPALANFFFGVGSMLVFGAATTMLTEFMPRRSSGGIAVNNFVRNILSCTGAVVAQPLINAMGVGWLCTMIGLFAFVSGYACIWSLKRWGGKWRKELDEKLNAM